MMSLLKLFGTGLALSASRGLAEDSVEAALARNDECQASGEGCALNALQLNAQQNASDSAWVAEFLKELGGSNEDLEKTEAELAGCSGSGPLPGGRICYGGAFLTEIFFVRAHDGKVSMWAKGPKPMKCLHRGYHQSGQSVSISGISECGLTGVEYNIQYCSTQDQILVNMVKPMKVTVTMTRRHC
eukprot:TRINITY_DN1569_c0_g1_i2.p1 TRINITY_DN1569_c0_g1~~TRINITY_DN1569_c0_g1_i2.p1  ORF type:complete len:186 (+),score=33.57 TRINITY_DN1569_c0_g1_i2:89-646(+)